VFIRYTLQFPAQDRFAPPQSTGHNRPRRSL